MWQRLTDVSPGWKLIRNYSHNWSPEVKTTTILWLQLLQGDDCCFSSFFIWLWTDIWKRSLSTVWGRVKKCLWFKVALINVFIIKMDHTATCYVWGVAFSDKPIDNHHFLDSTEHVSIYSISWWCWLNFTNLLFWFTPNALISMISRQRKSKPAVHYLLITECQTDQVSN